MAETKIKKNNSSWTIDKNERVKNLIIKDIRNISMFDIKHASNKDHAHIYSNCISFQ